MASDTEICNLALSHIGVDTEIQNLEQDKGAEARACRRFYDASRKKVLRDFDWPFARKIAALALVAENPNTLWAFSYQYPSDAAAFRKILSGIRNDNRQSRVPYEFGYGDNGQLIFTDQAIAVGKYTVDVTDPSRFDENFVMAHSLLLAFYMAPRLTAGDPFKMGDKCMNLYADAILRAQANAADEEQDEEVPESEFIRGRE